MGRWGNLSLLKQLFLCHWKGSDPTWINIWSSPRDLPPLRRGNFLKIASTNRGRLVYYGEVGKFASSQATFPVPLEGE